MDSYPHVRQSAVIVMDIKMSADTCFVLYLQAVEKQELDELVINKKSFTCCSQINQIC